MDKEKRNEYMRDYYTKNKGKIKNRVKRYRELNPEQVLQTRLKTHNKNPNKVNARRVVEAALNAGVLVKPEQCSKCGKTNCRIEAHHENHVNALDVVWLCVSCHRKRDYQIRQESGIIEKPNRKRKLTDDQIREIRSSNLSYSQLKKKYGVCVATLQSIKAGKTYKHVL